MLTDTQLQLLLLGIKMTSTGLIITLLSSTTEVSFSSAESKTEVCLQIILHPWSKVTCEVNESQEYVKVFIVLSSRSSLLSEILYYPGSLM